MISVSKITTDIPYGQHERQRGDLYFSSETSPTLLLIHGGGWNALNKEAISPVASLFSENGYNVFSINYRLLQHAPWPACGEDCLQAGKLLLNGGLEEYGLPDVKNLVICGASAGGHLSMMTGLRLPSASVRAIISVAGPTSLGYKLQNRASHELGTPSFYKDFFGHQHMPTEDQLTAASPLSHVTPESPPLYCIHSVNDQLVGLQHSQVALKVWHHNSRPASLITYAGEGNLHGIWRNHDTDRSTLAPAFREALLSLCDELAKLKE